MNNVCSVYVAHNLSQKPQYSSTHPFDLWYKQSAVKSDTFADFSHSERQNHTDFKAYTTTTTNLYFGKRAIHSRIVLVPKKFTSLRRASWFTIDLIKFCSSKFQKLYQFNFSPINDEPKQPWHCNRGQECLIPSLGFLCHKVHTVLWFVRMVGMQTERVLHAEHEHQLHTHYCL